MAASDAIVYWRLKLSFIYNVKRTKTVSSHQIISVVSRRVSKLPTLGWTLMSNVPSWEQMTWRMPESRPGRRGGKGVLGTDWAACMYMHSSCICPSARSLFVYLSDQFHLTFPFHQLYSQGKSILFLSWVFLRKKNSEEGSMSSVYSKFSASPSKVTHTNGN